MTRRAVVAAGLAGLALLAAGLAGCGRGGGEPAGTAVLGILLPPGERPFWEPIARSFEASRPGVRVDLIEGPQSTDLRENLYTAALLARDPTFDLVYLDVTWTPKLAAAGWLVPLDREFPPDELAALLPAAVEAGRYRGRLYRVPVRTDVGLVYARADWLEGAGLPLPTTYEELERAARALQSPPGRWGWVWQGRQYEGLVCVFLEVLTGHGGFWIDAATGEVGLDRPEAFAAAAFLARSCAPGGISPPGVTTYQEEESRRLFQDGRAAFLRNWPYAWRLAQREDSPLRGRVAVVGALSAPGGRPASTLGGWGLGVSRYSTRPREAVAFIRHATSLASQRALCAPTGYAPARLEAYDDPELRAANPLLGRLLELHADAVARPAVPGYAMASDILQRHLSAALSGAEPVERALRAAARETRLLTAAGGRR